MYYKMLGDLRVYLFSMKFLKVNIKVFFICFFWLCFYLLFMDIKCVGDEKGYVVELGYWMCFWFDGEIRIFYF